MNASLQVTLGQHSRAGRHGRNRDFHGAVLPGEPLRTTKGVALALADGIGSSDVSHVASAAAVRGFLDDYFLTSEAWPVRRAAKLVLAATNSWLHAQTVAGGARFDQDRGHVCTFSALVLKGRDAHALHVGDARICRLHPHALEPLTEDHRVRGADGECWLGRALGAAARVEIDYRRWSTEPGEVYLLTTDGAWAHLDAAAVHAALAAHGDDLDAAAAALADVAQARGSDDDVTLQLLRIDALPPAQAGAWEARREALALPPPLAPRQRFEGYTVVRELHVSARSHVHLAVDDRSGEAVVLKTPSVAGRDDPAYLDGFLLEEWVARRVDSPYVVRAHADDRPRRHLFTALEHVDGRTLAQWMTDHPRPGLDAVRGIVAQIARGLQALHRRDTLHRDLRPENVMIDGHGTVKLIDLAAAQVAGLAEGRREVETIRGSLQFTAPECFVGDAGSPRSDLFALAVLAYRMLGGGLPYGVEATRVRTRRDLAALRYRPLRATRPDLPPWIDPVLRQALDPRPERRHEALSAFVHDLHHPGPRHLAERPSPWFERDPVGAWRTLAVTLGFVAAGLAATLALRPAPTAPASRDLAATGPAVTGGARAGVAGRAGGAASDPSGPRRER